MKLGIIKQGLLLLAAAAAAVFLGSLLGQVISEKRAVASRNADSEAVLNSMGTIQVGRRLSDHMLYATSGDSVSLHEALSASSVICFYEPDCATCLELMRDVAATDDRRIWSSVLFVSTALSTMQNEVKRANGLDSLRTFCDRDGEWTRLLKVTVFPLSVFVDSSARIRSVVTGRLTQSEIAHLAND